MSSAGLELWYIKKLGPKVKFRRRLELACVCMSEVTGWKPVEGEIILQSSVSAMPSEYWLETQKTPSSVMNPSSHNLYRLRCEIIESKLDRIGEKLSTA